MFSGKHQDETKGASSCWKQPKVHSHCRLHGRPLLQGTPVLSIAQLPSVKTQSLREGCRESKGSLVSVFSSKVICFQPCSLLPWLSCGSQEGYVSLHESICLAVKRTMLLNHFSFFFLINKVITSSRMMFLHICTYRHTPCVSLSNTRKTRKMPGPRRPGPPGDPHTSSVSQPCPKTQSG